MGEQRGFGALLATAHACGQCGPRGHASLQGGFVPDCPACTVAAAAHRTPSPTAGSARGAPPPGGCRPPRRSAATGRCDRCVLRPCPAAALLGNAGAGLAMPCESRRRGALRAAATAHLQGECLAGASTSISHDHAVLPLQRQGGMSCCGGCSTRGVLSHLTPCEVRQTCRKPLTTGRIALYACACDASSSRTPSRRNCPNWPFTGSRALTGRLPGDRCC